MRTESRFLVTAINWNSLSEVLSTLNPKLKYRVANFYLDDQYGHYSRVEFDPPRLRVRTYSVEKWYFGNVELKFHRDKHTTDKRVWDLSLHWNEITSIIPMLKQKSLSTPSADSIFQYLVPTFEEDFNVIRFEQMRFIGMLAYTRESCGSGHLRLSVDSEFSPPVVPADEVIIEIKGDKADGLRERVAKCCSISLLEESKFSLLKKYYETTCRSYPF